MIYVLAARVARVTHEIHDLTHYSEPRVVFEEDDGPVERRRYYPAIPVNPYYLAALERHRTRLYEQLATEILRPWLTPTTPST